LKNRHLAKTLDVIAALGFVPAPKRAL
jgi:hypothetical protein